MSHSAALENCSFSPALADQAFDYAGADLDAMAAAQRYPRWVLEEFRPYLGSLGAEVGSGSGNFAKILLEGGLEKLTTFEPSRNLFPILEKRFEQTPQVSCVNTYLADSKDRYRNTFDSVVYNNVLEHVKEDQTELETVHEVLKPGGRVLIFVPALQWLYSEFDRSVGHYRRYEMKSAVNLIKRAGFEVEKAKYFDLLGVLPWLVVVKLLKARLGANKVGLYDNIGVPVTRFIEKLIDIPLGKNLLLVGRK